MAGMCACGPEAAYPGASCRVPTPGMEAELPHPSIPEHWPYRVAHAPGKGRGAFATRNILAGEVVAIETPTTVVRACDKGQERNGFCGRCLRKIGADGGAACGDCGAACCSAACLAAWQTELHTPKVCAALKAVKAAPVDVQEDILDEVLEGASLLVLLHCLRDDTACPYAGGYSAGGAGAWHDVSMLCHDAVAVEPDRKVQFEKTIALYRTHSQLEHPFSAERAYQILVQDMQNGLNLTYHAKDDTLLRGGCTYPRIAMFNHACYPNCVRIDYLDDPEHEGLSGVPSCATVLRALDAIPEGSELCISYTPIAYQSSERKEHLKETYRIECACERCELEDQMEEEQHEGEEGMEIDHHDHDHHDHDHDHDHCDDPDHHHHDHDMDEDAAPSAMAMYNVFTARFICPDDYCTGTLVPIRNAVDGARRAHVGETPGMVRPVMECNTCYRLRTEEEFVARMTGEEGECLPDDEDEDEDPLAALS